MAPHRLEGTSWHPSSPKMQENDTRRHKSRCIYYDKKTKTCTTLKSHYGFRTCGGSRHCPGYEERELEERLPVQKEIIKKPISKKKKEKIKPRKKKTFQKKICSKGDWVTGMSVDNPKIIKKYHLVENEKGKENLALKVCCGKKRNETFIIKGKKYKIVDIQGEK